MAQWKKQWLTEFEIQVFTYLRLVFFHIRTARSIIPMRRTADDFCNPIFFVYLTNIYKKIILGSVL